MRSSPQSVIETLRCDDGDAASTNDICASGICQGCPVPTDDCEVAAGTFDTVTQQCSAPAAAANGTACGAGGTCLTGICTGACGR